jgi:hypothetical protein
MVPTHVRKWPARNALFLALLALALFGPDLFRSRVVKARVEKEPAVAVSSLVYRTDKVLEETTRSNTILPSVRAGISASIDEITETLPPLEPAKTQGLRAEQIGVGRAAEISSSSHGKVWVNHKDGTQIRLFALRSPGAVGIRVHLDNFDLADGDEVYIYGDSPESHVAGPFTLKGPFGDGRFWSDTIGGDTVIVEHFSRGTERGFRIPEISHLFQDAARAAVQPEALSCEVDASCSNEPEKNSVARYDFVSVDGAVFICSGTLINDQAGDNAPYFMTANHCLNTSAEARTTEVFWFYQTNGCNSGQLRSDIVRSSPIGATLLVTDQPTDSSLLKINGAIPNGAVFSGFDPNPQTAGTPVFALHHPGGALPPDPSSALRRAGGSILDLNGACGASGLVKGYTVGFTNGVVEPGSSGSGIWVTENGQHRLVGQLSCGPGVPTCDPKSMFEYGRFSDFYAIDRVKTLLQSGGGCSVGLSFSSQSFGSSGGTGAVNVIAPPQCSWSASAADNWVAITSQPGGSGNGAVSFAVAANPTSAPRSTTLTIGGQTFAITQGVAAMSHLATLTLDSGNPTFAFGFRAGGTVWGVNRITPEAYPATMTEMLVFFPDTGGTGTITLLSAANPSGQPDLTGISFTNTPVMISDQDLDVYTAFVVPSLTINSGDFVVGYKMNSFPNQFPFAIDNNIPSARRSYVSIDGSKFFFIDDLDVNLAGNLMVSAVVTEGKGACGATISPTQQMFPSAGGTANVTVNVGSGCNWTASTSASWITIQPATGPSGQNAMLTIAPNTAGGSRAAAVNFSGEVFVVTQAPGDTKPSITTLSADLNGDTLTLTGTAMDAGGDIASATVTLLDSSNAVVNKFNPIPVSFGTSQAVNISLQVQGISAFPQAVMASLVLIDSQGISSTAVTADFSHGDPGAAVLTSASYDGSVLLVKGSGFTAPVQAEVNGTVVAPPLKAKVKGDTKIKISGSASDLNLKSGFNRVRVVENSARSNLVVFSN